MKGLVCHRKRSTVSELSFFLGQKRLECAAAFVVRMSSLVEVEGWVEKLMECTLLPENDIISLCKKAKEVFNQARQLSWKPNQ